MTVPTASRLDSLPAAEAVALLAPCCASRRFQQVMVAGRPYGGPAALTAAADATIAELPWDDVLEALAAHPRIGRRAAGDDVESQWSRAEQAAAASTDTTVTARLHDANVRYEQRFGWVFLICATGRSPEDVLAAATTRLDHDVATEQAEVREQLRQIVRLRLGKTFGDAA